MDERCVVERKRSYRDRMGNREICRLNIQLKLFYSLTEFIMFKPFILYFYALSILVKISRFLRICKIPKKNVSKFQKWYNISKFKECDKSDFFLRFLVYDLSDQHCHISQISKLWLFGHCMSVTFASNNFLVFNYEHTNAYNQICKLICGSRTQITEYSKHNRKVQRGTNNVGERLRSNARDISGRKRIREREFFIATA